MNPKARDSKRERDTVGKLLVRMRVNCCLSWFSKPTCDGSRIPKRAEVPRFPQASGCKISLYSTHPASRDQAIGPLGGLQRKLSLEPGEEGKERRGEWG